MSELHSTQPTGGTGAAPHPRPVPARVPDADPRDTGLAGKPRPRVGAAEADDAARITTGGTTGEGPLVGDGKGG